MYSITTSIRYRGGKRLNHDAITGIGDQLLLTEVANPQAVEGN